MFVHQCEHPAITTTIDNITHPPPPCSWTRLHHTRAEFPSPVTFLPKMLFSPSKASFADRDALFAGSKRCLGEIANIDKKGGREMSVVVVPSEMTTIPPTPARLERVEDDEDQIARQEQQLYEDGVDRRTEANHLSFSLPPIQCSSTGANAESFTTTIDNITRCPLHSSTRSHHTHA